jgi:hypothetical protein
VTAASRVILQVAVLSALIPRDGRQAQGKRFPGIESDTCFGTPAIRVNGKFMARLRTEAEGWLAIRCDFVDREILLQSAPHVFHLTPHYENYPMILVDLAVVDDDTLLQLVERAWRRQAPKKLVREWDERHNPPPAKPPAARKRPAKKRSAKKR